MTQLTVKELISLLSEQDQDAPVFTEGCDCDGRAGGVETCYDDDGVYIMRDE